MLHAFIFDLDDTLIDRRASLVRYAAKLRRELELDVSESHFTDRFMLLDENGRRPRPEFFQALANEFPEAADARQIQTHFHTHAWIDPLLFPDSVEILDDLRARGFATGIVTNGATKSQSAKLANTGLAERVDHYIISESFGAKKPSPKIFDAMCTHLDTSARNSAFVGDDPMNDVVAPAALGMTTIWIKGAIAWPEETPCPAVDRVERADLRDALEKLISG